MKKLNKLFVWVALGFMAVLPLLYGDYDSKEYPELNRAMGVVRYMSAERQLRRSSFYSVYPEGSPKQFVKWMFSPLGASFWPPAEGELEFSSDELKMMKNARIPILPEGVSLIAEKVDVGKGRQVVVRGEDQRQKLVVEAYLDPQVDSVLVAEWEFPLGGRKVD